MDPPQIHAAAFPLFGAGRFAAQWRRFPDSAGNSGAERRVKLSPALTPPRRPLLRTPRAPIGNANVL
jgi:hypothetical protein